MEQQLEQIAVDLVARAVRAGATGADATVVEADEFSTALRLGEIEKLKEAASKALGLRIFLGERSASSFSSDFSAASLELLVARTLAMAKVTSEDPSGGLPDASLLGKFEGDLGLYSPDVEAFSTEERIDYARRAERAARSTPIRGLRTQKADISRQRSAAALMPTHWDFPAAIAPRIARSLRLR